LHKRVLHDEVDKHYLDSQINDPHKHDHEKILHHDKKNNEIHEADLLTTILILLILPIRDPEKIINLETIFEIIKMIEIVRPETINQSLQTLETIQKYEMMYELKLGINESCDEKIIEIIDENEHLEQTIDQDDWKIIEPMCLIAKIIMKENERIQTIQHKITIPHKIKTHETI